MLKFYWPCRIEDGAYLGQKFGEKLLDYSQFGLIAHNGLDIIVDTGKPVYASTSGSLLYRQDLNAQGQFKGFGNYATITNSEGSTYYAHLEKFAGKDRAVQAGELIGYVDSTGFSSGAHLHFGFRPLINNPANGYGGCVDPLLYLAGENERPDMIEFVHKTGTSEYGFLETTQFSAIYYRGISEDDIKFQAKKFGVEVGTPIDFTKARDITI